MSITTDLTNQKFGLLRAIKYVGKSALGRSLWECLCDCGNHTVVIHSHLINGNTKSCGCLHRKIASEINTTHGHTKKGIWSATYSVWGNMIQRCNNERDTYYKDYGGRGITVCRQWLKFENFLEDMGERPPGLTLDRKNNNKNYCKSNCRWATPKQQQRNKRNNHLITFNGKTQCLAAWAEECDILYCTLKMRIRRGWPVDKALTTPIRIFGNGG